MHSGAWLGDWAPWLELVTGASYVVISVTLGLLVVRLRHEIRFHGVFLAFGAFIVACGLGHLIGAAGLTAGWPRTSAFISVTTAVASVATALWIPFLVPAVRAAVHDAREAGLQRAEMETLRRMETVKAQFMATMSHELRTPLTAVLGYTELLHDAILGPVVPAQQQALHRITVSSRHLLALIDDILAFEQTNLGPLPLVIQPTSIPKVIEDVVGLLGPDAKARGVSVHAVLPSSAPLLPLDERRVRQVVLNLVANAVKFTPAGTVTVTAVVGEVDVVLTVTDTGIGIAPEHLARIFDPFWQADASLTRTAGGTGLGLAITQRLVTRMGGRITCVSAPGRGSTFTVRLPRDIGPDTAAAAQPTPRGALSGRGARLLSSSAA